MIKYSVLGALFLQMLWCSSAFAHKINVFGYVDDGLVKTESTFSGGRAARHCQLSIQTTSGLIAIGKTDDGGLLDFPVTRADEGFDLVVVCGDGHRGTWRMDAEELQGSLGDDSLVDTSVKGPSETIEVADRSALRAMFREELAKELGPMKRQLAELKKDTISLADIMGGLGYFLGLAGLASYMRFRKERR